MRTILIALALAIPSIADAQQFRDSAVGAAVVADNGQVVGEVDHVVRDRQGRIVSAEISGQEPASAPYAPNALVADASAELTFVVDRRDDLRERRPAQRQTRTR